MANPTALILLLLAATAATASASAGTTTLFRDKKCVREIEGMQKWQCVLWMMSEKEGPYNREGRLQQCCDQLNKLSSGCRCDAIWQMMKETPKFGYVPCKLPQECGFSRCGTCPGGRAAAT